MVIPKMIAKDANDDQVEVPGYEKPEHYPVMTDELTCQRNEDCREMLREDHPGINDDAYLDHRNEINGFVADEEGNVCGLKIPTIHRPAVDHATWKKVYELAEEKHKQFACKEYLEGKKRMVNAGLLGPDKLPDVGEISKFLEANTGWRMRPASGLCSAREFLACLAFRCFPCVLYIRHHSQPGYSPEPDVVHELLGHAPMFLNQAVADFSQEIGLASLDATDEEVEQLARLYWYSLEFGLIKEGGVYKVFGAGILSAPHELERSLDPEITAHEWYEPHRLAHKEYDDTYEQQSFAVLHSMEEAMYHLRDFCHSLSAHHDLHYDQFHDKIFEAKKHCRKQEGSKLDCYRCQEKHPRDRMFDTPRPLDYTKFGFHDYYDFNERVNFGKFATKRAIEERAKV